MLVEGAGSAAEINLREGDIANMGFARAAECPVALIGDIDRGGIFAQILGTKAALAPEDAATIVGFIVNKFRGDASLFAGGMATIAERTGWRALGLLPFFPDAARLPAEDAFGLGDRKARADGAVTIAVPMLARIANFDDFDPLRMEPAVRLVFVRAGRAAAGRRPCYSARQQGDDRRSQIFSRARLGYRPPRPCAARRARARGVRRLPDAGQTHRDPDGIEGPPGEVEGLGLLDVATVLIGEKTLREVEGACLVNGAPFQGYEMHVGQTKARTAPGRFCASPTDGSTARSRRTAASRAPMCMGCSPTTASAPRGSPRSAQRRTRRYEATIERTLDALADHCEAHLDLDAISRSRDERRARARRAPESAHATRR